MSMSRIERTENNLYSFCHLLPSHQLPRNVTPSTRMMASVYLLEYSQMELHFCFKFVISFQQHSALFKPQQRPGGKPSNFNLWICKSIRCQEWDSCRITSTSSRLEVTIKVSIPFFPYLCL